MIPSATINPSYTEILDVQDRYLFLYGGAGSGKSHVIALKIVLTLLRNKKMRWIMCRKYLKHVRQSQFELIRKIINDTGLTSYFEVYTGDMKIVCKSTKSEIFAVGLDDPEKIKSIAEVSGAWLEELTEFNIEDFHQIDLRVRVVSSQFLQIIGSFNPISKEHWINKEVFKERYFEMGKLTRWTETSEDGYESHYCVLKTNYKHNYYLPASYKATLESFKQKDFNYYQVYVNAEWGVNADGIIFKREFYNEYKELPNDVRGVIYCDPNIGKKNGDDTAIVKLYYSPTFHKFFVGDVVCHTIQDPRETLKHIARMRTDNCKFIGMDGNYTQESTWSNIVISFCREHNVNFPLIDFKRYNVDDLSKNAQWIWNSGEILFPSGFDKTPDGERFLYQLFTFIGKKNTRKGSHDDGADALICALEYSIDVGLASVSKQDLKNIWN